MQQWWQNAQPGSTEYRREKGTFRQVQAIQGVYREKLLKKWQVIEASEICLRATNAIEVHPRTLKVNVRDYGLSPGPDAQVDLYILES